jgi:hypothetical protein
VGAHRNIQRLNLVAASSPYGPNSLASPRPVRNDYPIIRLDVMLSGRRHGEARDLRPDDRENTCAILLYVVQDLSPILV